MKSLFVSNEQAFKLNELGFNEKCLKKTVHKKECICKVNGSCPLPNVHCQYPDCEIDKSITPVELPLFSQAFAWIRDNFSINSYIRHDEGSELYYDYVINDTVYDYMSDTYEEAEIACLDKLIETLENK